METERGEAHASIIPTSQYSFLSEKKALPTKLQQPAGLRATGLEARNASLGSFGSTSTNFPSRLLLEEVPDFAFEQERQADESIFKATLTGSGLPDGRPVCSNWPEEFTGLSNEPKARPSSETSYSTMREEQLSRAQATALFRIESDCCSRNSRCSIDSFGSPDGASPSQQAVASPIDTVVDYSSLFRQDRGFADYLKSKVAGKLNLKKLTRRSSGGASSFPDSIPTSSKN